MHDTEKIIDQIYEAAAAVDLWPDVLQSISNLTESAGAALATRASDGWASWVASPALREPTAAFLESDVAERSEITSRMLARNHAGFLAEQDLFADGEFERDPFLTEIMGPRGMGSAMATAIVIPTGDLLVIHLQRTLMRGRYERHMIDRADALRPHLARAALLSARLRLQRLKAAAEALAMVGLPAAIMSLGGRVLAANNLLQEMKEHVHWLPRDRIALRDACANEFFIQGMGKKGKLMVAARSFLIASANGCEQVVGHLIPTPGLARDIFDGASAIFVLTPVSAPMAPDLTLIQALFDLTPAEARVARGVAAGQTINQLAQCFGVSRETIRSQLKGILAKTGAHRQADLVSQIGGIGTHRIC